MPPTDVTLVIWLFVSESTKMIPKTATWFQANMRHWFASFDFGEEGLPEDITIMFVWSKDQQSRHPSLFSSIKHQLFCYNAVAYKNPNPNPNNSGNGSYRLIKYKGFDVVDTSKVLWEEAMSTYILFTNRNNIEEEGGDDPIVCKEVAYLDGFCKASRGFCVDLLNVVKDEKEYIKKSEQLAISRGYTAVVNKHSQVLF